MSNKKKDKDWLANYDDKEEGKPSLLSTKEWHAKQEANPQMNTVWPDAERYGVIPAITKAKKFNSYVFQQKIEEKIPEVGDLDIIQNAIGGKYRIPLTDKLSISPEAALINSNVDVNGVHVANKTSPAFKASINYTLGNGKKKANGGWLDSFDEGGHVHPHPPKSEFKRLYGHGTEYSVGQRIGEEQGEMRIDPETGKGYFPLETSNQQQAEVPKHLWNTSRFLYQPFMVQKQEIHNATFDSDGNYTGVKENFSPEDSTRQKFKNAKEDISNYYKEDLGQEGREARQNIKDRMKEIHKMNRAQNTMGDYTFYGFQDPTHEFDAAVGKLDELNKEYFPDLKSNPYYGQKPLSKRQAKRAYTNFQKAWRDTPAKEARQNSREELKAAEERAEKYERQFTKGFTNYGWEWQTAPDGKQVQVRVNQKPEQTINKINKNESEEDYFFRLNNQYKANGGWLDSYDDGGAVHNKSPHPHESTEDKIAVDKDSNRPVTSGKKSGNVKVLQASLFDQGYYPEGTTRAQAVDGDWGDMTQNALTDYEKATKGIFGKQMTSTLPINISALINDVTGIRAPISASSLTDEELKVFQKIAKTNLTKGKSTISYADYGTHLNEDGTLKEAAKKYSEETGNRPEYFDVGPNSRSYIDKAKGELNSAYMAKTLVAQANIIKTPQNDTLIVDDYNFNNANKGGVEGYIKDLAANPSLYNIARAAGKNFGSGSGEGAKTIIKTNKEKTYLDYLKEEEKQQEEEEETSWWKGEEGFIPDELQSNKQGGWLDTYEDGGELPNGEKVPADSTAAKPSIFDQFASAIGSVFEDEPEKAAISKQPKMNYKPPPLPPPSAPEDFFAFKSSTQPTTTPAPNTDFTLVTEEHPVFGERTYREYKNTEGRSLEEAKKVASQIDSESYKKSLGAYGDRTNVNWSYYKDDLFTPVTQASRSKGSETETYTPYEVVMDVAGKLDIDPALLYTNLQTEGMDKFLAEHRKFKKPTGPLGFYHLGVDTFGQGNTVNKAKELLPGTFVENETYRLRKARNEKREDVTSANFTNLKTGIAAAAVMLKESTDRVSKLAEKYNLSKEAEEFFTYVDYNAGQGNAQKMAESWNKKGYLEDDRWIDARPDESWKAPYNFAIKRYSNKRALDNIFRGTERIDVTNNEEIMDTKSIGQLPVTPSELPIAQEIKINAPTKQKLTVKDKTIHTALNVKDKFKRTTGKRKYKYLHSKGGWLDNY